MSSLEKCHHFSSRFRKCGLAFDFPAEADEGEVVPDEAVVAGDSEGPVVALVGDPAFLMSARDRTRHDTRSENAWNARRQ